MDNQFSADALRPPLPDWPPTLLRRLRQRYGEPHRHYHTWGHVLECLEARRRITTSALPEVDLALLFHDAIYEPLAGDNESRSAELLVEEGRRAWIEEGILQGAKLLVGVTAHHKAMPVDSEEACIVLDADLSILGAEPSKFARYERAVREEFAHLEEDRYVAGRSALLRDFLERPSIYLTQRGRRLWESNARRNLERSVANLSSCGSILRAYMD
jgi:predicted metal-dependent HD superfamily phosphohydrolase